jgi:hypothetical protein
MNIEELKNSLLAAPKNGFARLSADERIEMEAHAKGYAAFIDACKTEREAVVWAVELLKKHGFVELIPGARMVTFGNGMVAKELFLGCDQDRKRLAYSVRTERFTHHSASFVVTALGAGKCRLTWTADVLPDDVAPTVAGMMEAGLQAAKPVLGRVPA